MRPVSAAFLQRVSASHTMAVEADALLQGAVTAEGLPIVAGSVTRDRGQLIRARCDLTVGPGYVPTDPLSPLAPYGQEVRVKRGVVHPDGSTELVGLGVFRIEDVDPQDDGSVRLTGLDRAAHVVDARLEAPWVVAAGTNWGTAIRDLLLAGYPDLPVAFAAVPFTAPQVIVEEQADRWATAVGWAASCGYELFLDGDGVCILQPEPTLGGAVPVWTLAEGPGGLLVHASAKWSRGGRYNRVVAVGENASAATVYRGVWTDDDPTSVTRYGGPYGRVPRFYASPLLGSDAQAAEAAASVGRRGLGTTQPIEWAAFPNPALEEGDAMTIQRLASAAEVHLVEAVTHGLSPADTSSGTTRTQQVEA